MVSMGRWGIEMCNAITAILLRLLYLGSVYFHGEMEWKLNECGGWHRNSCTSLSTCKMVHIACLFGMI